MERGAGVVARGAAEVVGGVGAVGRDVVVTEIPGPVI